MTTRPLGRSSLPAKPVDKKKIDFDTGFKIVGVGLTLITILIGIYQYNQGMEREFRKNFYERQLQVYNELIAVCSKIATSQTDSLDSPSFLLLETRLNEQYHGPLSLYENNDVEAKVSDFLVSLQRFKRDDNSDQIVDNDVMKKKCLLITQACRNSLAETYDVVLKELRPTVLSQSDSTSKVSNIQ